MDVVGKGAERASRAERRATATPLPFPGEGKKILVWPCMTLVLWSGFGFLLLVLVWFFGGFFENVWFLPVLNGAIPSGRRWALPSSPLPWNLSFLR